MRKSTVLNISIQLVFPVELNFPSPPPIDLKRITRYKLAVIFESANHRKFLGLFGSEAARLLTSNEATLEGYAIKQVFDHM
jgi:hypothetical protein